MPRTMTTEEMDAAIDRPVEQGCTTLWKLIDRLIEVAREPHSHAGTVGNLPVFTRDEASVGSSYVEGTMFGDGHQTGEGLDGEPWMAQLSPYGYTVIG